MTAFSVQVISDHSKRTDPDGHAVFPVSALNASLSHSVSF